MDMDITTTTDVWIDAPRLDADTLDLEVNAGGEDLHLTVTLDQAQRIIDALKAGIAATPPRVCMQCERPATHTVTRSTVIDGSVWGQQIPVCQDCGMRLHIGAPNITAPVPA